MLTGTVLTDSGGLNSVYFGAAQAGLDRHAAAAQTATPPRNLVLREAIGLPIVHSILFLRRPYRLAVRYVIGSAITAILSLLRAINQSAARNQAHCGYSLRQYYGKSIAAGKESSGEL